MHDRPFDSGLRYCFHRCDVANRVGLTNEHIMKIIEAYYQLLERRYAAGKSGDSDPIRWPRKYTDSYFQCFEPTLDNVLVVRELVNYHQKGRSNPQGV